MTQNDNANRLRRLITGDERKMYTGRLLPNGTVTLDGAPTNKVWVRYPKSSREQTAAWGGSLKSDVPVMVKRGSRGLYISGVDWVEGTQTFGAALEGLITPPIIGDVTGATIDGPNFKPGRLRKSSRGFPWVHVDAFHYDNGYWRGGEPSQSANGGLDQTAHDKDITAYLPATAGHVGWLVVYLDPSDDVLHLIAGTTQPGVIANLDEADIHNISLPDGVYPLGAVAVSNGMTAWGSNSRFVDYRFHIDQFGTPDMEWNRIVTDANYDIVVDASGNVVTSS